MNHADACVFDSEIETVGLAPRSSRRRERTDSHSITAVEFALQWQSQYARHTDCLVEQKFNPWRDLLTPELEANLEGRPGGYRDLEIWSLRGLPRPRDDKDAARRAFAAPVYGVWGVKI